MAFTYTYSISGDFPNDKVAPDVLTDQIDDSSISSGVLEAINVRVTGNDNCDIIFDQQLSAPDETTLNGLVAAHNGNPYLDITPGEPGWNLDIQDRHLTEPPASPTAGLYYIVAAGATGNWAGHDDCLASWNGTTWLYQRPSTGLAVWVIDEEIVVVWVDDTSKWQPYGVGGGSPPVFGSGAHSAESLAVSTTTAASWQSKLPMVTATLSAGLYRMEVSYGWNSDSVQNDFFARVTQDGAQLGEAQQQEASDAGGVWGSTGTDQRNYTSRVFMLNLAAQSYTFALEYKPQQAGDEASIFDAHMTLWRVS